MEVLRQLSAPRQSGRRRYPDGRVTCAQLLIQPAKGSRKAATPLLHIGGDRYETSGVMPDHHEYNALASDAWAAMSMSWAL